LFIDAPSIEESLPLSMISPAIIQTRADEGTQRSVIRELAASIGRHGLLQPIIVRPARNGFEIVAGHRRFFACKLLRWKAITAHVKELSDKDAFEIQLVENIQRRTLNSVEEARSFKLYVTEYGWGGITQLAYAIMKSEQYVSSRIQLLNLPEDVLQKIENEELKVSHALEILRFGENEQKILANSTISKKLSVKDLRNIKNILNVNDDVTTIDNVGIDTYSGDDVIPFIGPFRQKADKDNGVEKESETVYNGLFFGNDKDKLDTGDKKSLFLKKVQLTLKISLSRVDSLIHEYEESFRDDVNQPESCEDDINNKLLKYRFIIHSIIDENIRLIISQKKIRA
jgi:ParB family transcriptional regulator, chromosome partitioning protein